MANSIGYANPSLLFLLIISTQMAVGQGSTDVFLMDIAIENGKTVLAYPSNISNNEGYDNQPSFYDDHTILFSSNRNGQTDVAQYDILTGEKTWLTHTELGSEYSPMRIPNSQDFSAIRLDQTGLQRLYHYNRATGKSKAIREDAKVGYHVWHSSSILVQTVLVEDRMDLVISNLMDKTDVLVHKNVGRSLHKIPNTELISYIAKQAGIWSLNSLDPISGATHTIGSLPIGTEDICWLPDGTFLVPSGNLVSRIRPGSMENPEVISLSEHKEIGAISRMAISPSGKQLALVSEDPPYKIVQKQVDAYNAGDLDAFISCYAPNVKVSHYPNQLWYEGQKRMRTVYAGLSPSHTMYQVEVVKRITLGNKVLDYEKVTGQDKILWQAAIYEVENGKISTMTFIFEDTPVPQPEIIVQEQLDAYNARDIDAFLNTYTDDVQLFNFPAELRRKGKAEMREGYGGYFQSTPDLHCQIKNRIVIGNKVIDEEYVTANGEHFRAVAIYEVEHGKINKVTFLR